MTNLRDEPTRLLSAYLISPRRLRGVQPQVLAVRPPGAAASSAYLAPPRVAVEADAAFLFDQPAGRPNQSLRVTLVIVDQFGSPSRVTVDLPWRH